MFRPVFGDISRVAHRAILADFRRRVSPLLREAMLVWRLEVSTGHHVAETMGAQESRAMTEEHQALVERFGRLMKRHKGYSEKKMFGGVCFMVNGNMCVGPWKGALIVRLDKENHEQTLSEPHVKPMDITGKVMKGWALVEPDGIESEKNLKMWVDRGVKFARSLPPK